MWLEEAGRFELWPYIAWVGIFDTGLLPWWNHQRKVNIKIKKNKCVEDTLERYALIFGEKKISSSFLSFFLGKDILKSQKYCKVNN